MKGSFGRKKKGPIYPYLDKLDLACHQHVGGFLNSFLLSSLTCSQILAKPLLFWMVANTPKCSNPFLSFINVSNLLRSQIVISLVPKVVVDVS